MNPNPRTPVLTLAGAAVALLVGACSSGAGSDTGAAPAGEPPSSSPRSASPEAPVDLARLPEGTSLRAATYLLPYLSDSGPMRAVVDVPAGTIGGGSVIETTSGDAAVWGTVTRVATDPCLGGSRPVGPSVHDLAAALAAQRHMSTSRPVRVTVGGYHGLYVESVAPASLQHCRHRSVLLYTAGGTWLQSDVPRATFRAWILDVRGQRVLAGTRAFADTPDMDALGRMVETARFVSVDESTGPRP